jgi:hypothetical protein
MCADRLLEAVHFQPCPLGNNQVGRNSPLLLAGCMSEKGFDTVCDACWRVQLHGSLTQGGTTW